MLTKTYPHYISSFDNTKLFVCTNFPDTNEVNDNVLIFNYGLVCNSAHWEKQIQHFDQSGYKVLYYDLRGHFNSQGAHNIEGISFDVMTKDLHCILNSLKINSSVLLGHSMGVNIALEYAKRHPENIKAMVLIAGTVFAPHDVMFNSTSMSFIFPLLKLIKGNFPKIYEQVWKTGGLNPIARYIITQGGFNVKEVSDEFVQVYLNRVAKLPAEIFLKLLEEMRDHDILPYLDTIKTQTLIIGGENDKVIPFYVQRIMHNSLENSFLYKVKDGSHVPQVDFPDSINEVIESYIKKYL